MIGTTISHYVILEKLGEGGMGVVYKAEDTTLKRVVALKFLPQHVSATQNDKARFLQEAQAAAALNHPNICTIYGIEEHEGQIFIAMEFVEGRTLREEMGSLNLKQAIEIGINIAEGLAAAHEKGIVHRDIKPENIMIRRDGLAQIMDFGLAKLRSSSSRINRLTKEGSTVGTAGYMSPEQIQGRDADHRSDIFSLGVVLYELFTGMLPFRGVHETALAYEIVNVDAAPMSAVRAEIDPGLDAIVLDCMEKDPRERCQSVAEVARDLRRVKRESSRQRVSRITASRPAYSGSQIPVQSMPGARVSGVTAPPSGTAAAVRPAGLPWIVALVFLLTTIGALAYHFLAGDRAETLRVVRSTLQPPEKYEFNTSNGGHLALSPDGSAAAFVATDSTGKNLLWVRPLSSLSAVALQGTEGASYPFWSSDSRSIAFFAKGKLKKIDAHGGPTLTICDASDGRGGSWGAASVIVFSPSGYASLWKVAAAGGVPAEITTLDTTRGERSHRWPEFLPDGDHFLFVNQTSSAATDSDAVCVGSLEEKTWNMLFRGSSNLAYSSGRLLFLRQSILLAQPFDLGSLAFTGDAVPIAEKVQYNPSRSRGMFSASDHGILIYQNGEGWEPDAGIFDRAGRRTGLLGERGIQRARISPDGKRVAFDLSDPQSGRSDIWVHDISRRMSSRLTFDPAVDVVPVWSPKGDSIVFSSNRSGRFALYIKNADGTGEEQLLAKGANDIYASSWSADGSLLSVSSLGDPRTKIDLMMVQMSGGRALLPYLQTGFNEWVGKYSPDGRWLAYQSDETGKNEIYVRAADGSGGKWQISAGGGNGPSWPSDGQGILYNGPGRKLVLAHVSAGGTGMIVDSLSTLFDFESRGISGGGIFDASADGQMFVARVAESRGMLAPITLEINWDREIAKP